MKRRAESAAGGGEPPEVKLGWCAPEVARELPHLRLLTSEAPLSASCVRPSPAAVRERLASLSNRFNGGKAIALRREAIPASYRAFFREIGLDPDVNRIPIEAAVFLRMFDGAFVSTNLLEDALLIALVDTAVAVWALDSESLDGELGVRTGLAGETLGRGQDRPQLDGGELVVADSSVALSLLCEQPVSAARPQRCSRRLRLYALQVEGVSSFAVQEALWVANSTLRAQR